MRPVAAQLEEVAVVDALPVAELLLLRRRLAGERVHVRVAFQTPPSMEIATV